MGQSFPKKLALCVWSVVWLWPHTGHAQTAAEIFERAFGAPQPKIERILPVPLIVEGQYRGDIDMTVGADQDRQRVDGSVLINTLSGILTDKVMDVLRKAVEADGLILITDVDAAGLETAFDPGRVELTVNLPIAVRRLQSTGLRSRRPPASAARAIRPSQLSGFANVRTAMSHVQRADAGAKTGRQPARLDLDGAVNWNRTVFEWRAFYQEDAARPWQRGAASVNRDDIDRRLRFSAGDLSYPVSGFQSFVPMGGLSVSKNFDIQPYRVTQPGGETSFVLQRPSQVEVFINDRLVRTLQLPAGPQNVRDFPFSSGANDVRLRITDDVGRVEVLEYPFFFDTRLLARGEDQFAYSVGLPSSTQGGLRKYARGRATISVFHRVGLTDSLTAGSTLQADRKAVNGGGEATWVNRFGTLLADLSISANDFGDLGSAARLRYRYANSHPRKKASDGFQISFSYRGDDYATVGSDTINNPIAFDTSARYSRRLWRDTSAGMGATYQFGRNARSDTNSVNLFLSRRLGSGASATLRFERRQDSAGAISGTGLLTLSVPLGANRLQNVDFSRDSGAQTSRLGYRYMPARQIGAFSGDLSINRNQRTNDLGGSLKYTGSRGQIEVSQDVAQSRSPAVGDNTDVRSQFRTASSFAFADGAFGMGRPISNSFVLVSPHPALKGHAIGVNPTAGTYKARIDRLGSGVLPNVPPYRVSRVIIDAPELPPGLELGDQVIDILPTNRSGTHIVVGTGAVVFAIGTLQTSDRLPVGLQAGRLHSIAAPDAEPLVLITNRRGRFIVEGLKPGRYELRMLVAPGVVIPIEIPEGARGRYDVGPIVLPTENTPATSRIGARP